MCQFKLRLCAIYFPLLGYTKYRNGNKPQKKISRFSMCALRPTLGAFLRDIGGKIAGIPQCRALGTTLDYVMLNNDIHYNAA